jgi:nucleotide-binding universal stress UspA family protein
MFQNILLGFDGSPHAKKALDYAIYLAKLEGGTLTIASVFPTVPAYLGSPNYDQAVARARAEAEQAAGMAAEQARAIGVPQVNTEVLEGEPAERLVAVADTAGCDLIVVGARGLGQMAGLLLGSVSDRLAHHAKIPVLIVK